MNLMAQNADSLSRQAMMKNSGKVFGGLQSFFVVEYDLSERCTKGIITQYDKMV